MLTQSHKIWTWLVTSSENPQAVSLTVKGILVGVVPFLLQFLPLVGIHVSPDFANLPDYLCGIVFWTLSIVAAFMSLVGFLRKLFNTLVPATPDVPPAV